ncbi:MAG: TetR/AcrR family transcriptional regulator [Bacteroidetes bacterium]|nr:MAG: TetR/AcrR family transcriptional regulator [Bacteroidota bacterium]
MLSDRQTEIIEKSIDIIGTKGIQGLTIKNLSKEIGISEPAIYRHFDSKTSILIAILDNFKEMASFMGDSMKENNNAAMTKIEFMFSQIIGIFSETPSFISVIFSEEIFRNEKILKDKIIEIMDQNEQTVEQIISSGQQKGELRTDIDAKTLALIVMGTLRFRIKQWDLKDYHGNMISEGAALIENLKKILSK